MTLSINRTSNKQRFYKPLITIVFFIVVQITLAQTSMAKHAPDNLHEPIVPIPNIQISDKNLAYLGFKLFHDKRLSANNTISCSSCHPIENYGVDNLVLSVGINGGITDRNTPTVLNSSLNFSQFWDGRADTLEEQIDGPILNKKEMGSSWKQILLKLNQDSQYLILFKQSFPSSGITIENIKLAISTYERTLLTPDSPFDLYLKGDDFAISQEQKDGYQLFKDYGCTGCHQGVAIGGNMYGILGIVFPYYTEKSQDALFDEDEDFDLGRYQVTKREQDKFVFKVPSLRNVALTAPYFHDGSVKTLYQSVALMIKYQLGKPISKGDILKIISFLNSLTAPLPKSSFDNVGPVKK